MPATGACTSAKKRRARSGTWRCSRASAGNSTRRASGRRLLEKAEQLKASIRAKVEHPFHVIKNLIRHKKTRYKGLAKNEAHLFNLFGLANLVIAKRSLLVAHARGTS
jgi:IS5 family transposase